MEKPVPRWAHCTAGVRALGEPRLCAVKVEHWEPKPMSRCDRFNSGFFEKLVLAGDEHGFTYPALGLTFFIDRVDRPWTGSL